MPTLHVYLDESGNLGFTPKGTKYYVFAVAWTYEPEPLATDLTRLRFSLLKDGHNISAFHAAEEKQENRDEVVSTLVRHHNWQFAGIVIEKNKVAPKYYEHYRFYPRYASNPLSVAFSLSLRPTTNSVLVFTDSLPVQKHKDSVEKAIKSTCRAMLPKGLQFHSYHHRLESNIWIQVADYCCWAIFRKWEQGDDRTYNQLVGRLVSEEIDLLADQSTTHY